MVGPSAKQTIIWIDGHNFLWQQKVPFPYTSKAIEIIRHCQISIKSIPTINEMSSLQTHYIQWWNTNCWTTRFVRAYLSKYAVLLHQLITSVQSQTDTLLRNVKPNFFYRKRPISPFLSSDWAKTTKYSAKYCDIQQRWVGQNLQLCLISWSAKYFVVFA